jgi:hypothetical protein
VLILLAGLALASRDEQLEPGYARAFAAGRSACRHLVVQTQGSVTIYALGSDDSIPQKYRAAERAGCRAAISG